MGLNVENFLASLKQAQAQPKRSEDQTDRKYLEKVYLSIPDNLAKYQVFPMISTTTGMPFSCLYRTREFLMDRGRGRDNDMAWFKLLPIDAYQFMDSTGRLVSSLTQAEADLLAQAYEVFDRLYNVLSEKDKKTFTRYKNYTVFNAKCINKYELTNINNPVRSNFSALFVCTSKEFAGAIDKDINNQALNYGGNTDFVSQIYNRQLDHRTGWLIFTVDRKPNNGIGFAVTASHTANLNPSITENYVITEEEANMMQDPVKNFLGWQAGDTNNLFNHKLINEMIENMSRMIAKVNSASSTLDPQQVAQATQATAQQAVAPQQKLSNDPVVREYQMNSNNVAPQQTMAQSPQQVSSKNDDPYTTPPAAQMDPVTGAPVNYGQPQPMGGGTINPQVAPEYTQPTWAQTAQGFQQPQPAGFQSGNGAPQQVENPFNQFAQNSYNQGQQ